MHGRTAFRFLHSGDFRLGQVPFGISDASQELRQQLLASPRQAAENVFDAAIQQQVDFVLLVGRLAESVFNNGDIGVQSANFLIEQFERLDREGIAVCLADETHWPDWCPLPENVRRVQQGGLSVTNRAGQSVTMIDRAGVSGRNTNASHSTGNGEATFRITVTERDQLSYSIPANVDYVASVGNESAGQLSDSSSNATIWCCGTPQGRHPKSGQQHGCLIVDVDGQGADVQLIETADVAWVCEDVSVQAADTIASIAERIRHRHATLSRESNQSTVLVDWVLSSQGSIDGRLVGDESCQQLFEEVQRFGDHGASRVHSLSVRVDSSRAMSVQSEAGRVVLADFVELAAESLRFDSGQTELQRLPWLSSEFADAAQGVETRVVRHGFDLLG